MTEKEFEKRVTALTQEMYAVASSLLGCYQDRQDAVQECIWRAWRGLPKLRNEAFFKAWLMRILINECRSIGRRLSRETVTDRMEEKAQDTHAERMRDEALHQAVMCLPEKLRLTVTLFYIDGFSLRETAHALRIPEGTVKSRLSQARKKLRLLLEREV